MSRTYDAIVIGAGPNGLTTAAYLARAGRKVLVLERRHLVGGTAATEEIVPGFKFSVGSSGVSLRPSIIRELDLAAHGFQILPLDGTFAPMPGGDSLWCTNDRAHTFRQLSRHSPRDAEIYEDYGRAMAEAAAFARPLLDQAPPDPFNARLADLRALGDIAKRFRRLSVASRATLLQLLTMSAADFLDQWFETDVLKAAIAASGLVGTFLGVRSPGTAYGLLHRTLGEVDGTPGASGLSLGGSGRVAEAIAGAARAAGAEIRVQTPVKHIIVRHGEATGVALENGDVFLASHVFSSIDPRRTLLGMVGDAELPAEFVEAIQRYRFRGADATVNLALDGLPDFTCKPGPGRHLRGTIAIAPSVDDLKRAYDQAKYGEYSRRPFIEIVIPSVTDPTVAPPGKHVMSCRVHYAPYHLTEGRWDDCREAFGDRVLDTIAEHAPAIKDRIIGRQILTPWDLEQTFGLTEGHIFQGALTLDQLFFLRPAPGWAGYRTPIQRLYLCGSATHPGGGLMGAPGRNAALRILAEGGR